MSDAVSARVLGGWRRSCVEVFSRIAGMLICVVSGGEPTSVVVFVPVGEWAQDLASGEGAGLWNGRDEQVSVIRLSVGEAAEDVETRALRVGRLWSAGTSTLLCEMSVR